LQTNARSGIFYSPRMRAACQITTVFSMQTSVRRGNWSGLAPSHLVHIPTVSDWMPHLLMVHCEL